MVGLELKARKEIDKVDNDRVNPFKVVVSFSSIKDCIDGTITLSNSEAVSKLVGKYQLEGDDAYSFEGERYACIGYTMVILLSCQLIILCLKKPNAG